MRDILVAILALMITGFIQSCTSGKAEEKVAVEKAEAKPAVVDLAIPDLFKGMADDSANSLGGLKVGDTAPDINVPMQDGSTFDLQEALKSGPVGLIFYRGFWCPKCTKHLAALEEDLVSLQDKGLQLFAITPEQYEYVDKTIEKTKLSYPLIYDADQSVMNDYKVLYKVTDDYSEKVGGFAGVGLAESHGKEEAYMPVPATYLIGQDGKIFYAHYKHDYGDRATAQDMIAALDNL